uniref:IU_nuc_hydro domain-containing protein n=1 Tax=Caenorhabditis tropicalis TaxID=1561998 RepID=A0A1I7TTN5_9PELO
MKTIYVWLFLCQLPLIQSCLVVRSDQVECGPNDDTSLIFAYSNGLGLDSDAAANWFEGLRRAGINPRVTGFGSIRFDSPIEEDVQVHSSIADTINSIASNLRSPLSGTPQNDVRSAIEKILSTKKLQICGSSVVFYTHYLVQMFPSEELIARLRAKHISIYTVEPPFETPSYLGWISSKTYGYSVVANLTGATWVSINVETIVFTTYVCTLRLSHCHLTEKRNVITIITWKLLGEEVSK